MAKDQSSTRELLFLHVISMFQAAGMQQLGKIADPVTGEVARDLGQAKVSIDILEALKEKTQGNLNGTEAEFLDKVLFELHMNYVDELKTSKEAGEEGAEEGDEKKEASAGQSPISKEGPRPSQGGEKDTQKREKQDG